MPRYKNRGANTLLNFMGVSIKQKCITDLYMAERLHYEVYRSLSRTERNAELRSIMHRLARLERSHAALWSELLSLNRMRVPGHEVGAEKAVILISRRLLGLAITMKIIEHREAGLHSRFNKILSMTRPSAKEIAIISKIRESEEKEETRLEKNVVEYGKFFNNIRDVMFGMNDGLVELLAVAVGFAAALRTPLIIFLAGFIVAISGTLSMAAGAYLSTEYEKGISRSKGRDSAGSARSSAFYVGTFYFIGSLFPLAPFALGYLGYSAMAISIILTAVVLTFTSSLIALASDKSIVRAVAKTLLISLGVAAITILLGSYVRSAFHITV